LTFTNTIHSSQIKSTHQEDWSLRLEFTESSGAGNSVTLGGSSNASNGQDSYDLPEPPAPPQLPYIRAWFSTPFSIPYNYLLQEYKHIPSQRIQAVRSNFNSFNLYKNNKSVADLLTQNSYSFLSNGTLYLFQIIAQNTSINGGTSEGSSGASERITISMPIIFLGFNVLIIIIAAALFYYKRKK
jgi:hypothetical protein